MKICCVGIAVYDRIFRVDNLPSVEGKYFASGLSEQGGGPAATAAVAVSRLGVNVDMIARVGDDATGQAIVKGLADEGVNTSTMRILKNAASTQASIMVDKDGSRIILSYPSPDLIPDSSFIEKLDFTAYSAVLADVRWPEGAKTAFEMAKKSGVPTVLDADTTPQPIDDLVALADYAVFSEPGLAKFTGISGDIETSLRAAAAKIEGRVIVTLGADGYSYLSDDGKIRHVPGFKVNVVDTTGAGDVFHGAFAVGLSKGMSIADTLRFAAGTAALKCTKAGGRTGIPSVSEVDAFLAQQTNS